MEYIEVKQQDRVLTLRFNRPDKKNAITQAMYAVLAEEINRANESGDIRVIVFLGREDVFTAGNDIQDFLALAQTDMLKSPVIQFLMALARNSIPVVAGVDGLAIGVGTTLLMHCDLVYVTEQTVLQTPFVDLGLVPEAGSSLLAPQIMGHKQAFRLLALGEKLTAAEAISNNLATEIVDSTELEAKVYQMAGLIKTRAPTAMAHTRKLIKGDTTELLQRIEQEAILFQQALNSPEAQEAFAAFLEKRAPNF